MHRFTPWVSLSTVQASDYKARRTCGLEKLSHFIVKMSAGRLSVLSPLTQTSLDSWKAQKAYLGGFGKGLCKGFITVSQSEIVGEGLSQGRTSRFEALMLSVFLHDY